jgi:GWxTD domain-containing protein
LIAVIQTDAGATTGDSSFESSEATRRPAGIVSPASANAMDSSETYVRLGRLYRSTGTIVGRLRAQRVLEHGLAKFPDDARLLVEMGRNYYDQRLYGDAARVFSRALDAEPWNCDAHYFLGINAYRKWRSVQTYTSYLSIAIEHLRIAAGCSDEGGLGLKELAFASYSSGDTALAGRTCSAWRRADPVAADPFFLIGCMSYDRGLYDECWENFKIALERLPEADRLCYADFGLLLAPDGDQKRRQSGPASDPDSTRTFWLEIDPDPTTEINERLVEHVYRVFLSEMRFALPQLGLRGWETPRGRALIKFGEPAHIRTTLEGIKPMDGRAEWWTYVGPQTAFQMQFRDEYLNGNYIVPLFDDISTEALTYEPPTTAHESQFAEIPCDIDAVVFRGRDLSASMYVTCALDADSLAHHIWSWGVDSFVARAAIFETNSTPHAYLADTLASDSLSRFPVAASRRRFLIRRYELPPAAYRVAFSIQDSKSLTRSLGWSRVDATRFLGRALVMSDVLLCSTHELDLAPTIHRFGSDLLPNPGHHYRGTEDLRIYVEAYNLALSDGRSEYEVTYSVFPEPQTLGRAEAIVKGLRSLLHLRSPADAVISQSFQRVGEGDSVGEEVAIDINALSPGAYVVSVSVRDKISGARTERTAHFVRLGNRPDRDRLNDQGITLPPSSGGG